MRLGEPKKVCFVWCAHGLCFGFFSFASPYIFYTLRLDQFFFHFRLKMKYLMRVNHDFRIINFICVFFSSFSFYLFCFECERVCLCVCRSLTIFRGFCFVNHFSFGYSFMSFTFYGLFFIFRHVFSFYLNERN